MKKLKIFEQACLTTGLTEFNQLLNVKTNILKVMQSNKNDSS